MTGVLHTEGNLFWKVIFHSKPTAIHKVHGRVPPHHSFISPTAPREVAQMAAVPMGKSFMGIQGQLSGQVPFPKPSQEDTTSIHTDICPYVEGSWVLKSI